MLSFIGFRKNKRRVLAYRNAMATGGIWAGRVESGKTEGSVFRALDVLRIAGTLVLMPFAALTGRFADHKEDGSGDFRGVLAKGLFALTCVLVAVVVAVMMTKWRETSVQALAAPAPSQTGVAAVADEELPDEQVGELPDNGMIVSIEVDGRVVSVMVPGGSVSGALDKAGVELHSMDEIDPLPHTQVEDGMSVSIVRVSSKLETASESIPFEVTYKKDASLMKGQEKISVEGKKGLKVVTTEVVTRDGIEVSRSVVRTEVEKEPVDKVIRQGTKTPTPKPKVKKTPTPKPTPTPTPKPVPVKNDSGEIYKVKSGSKTYTVDHTMVVEITAYTHTGKRTATGTMPKRGTIAVDRNVIPLGTWMYIPGYGIGKAEDVGVNGPQIDVFMDSERQCVRWGRKRDITIYIFK